ncbi:MAG: TlyA family RNA methyltransferase [Lachnospiraceae bacterium]|nr:TlyA family RNA methyltransferase [Lachnospiraceae bacterium]
MKERLDVLLVSKGFFDSREKAKIAVMEGLVYVNGQKEDKAGSSFPEDVSIEVRGKTLPYVSRGGLKLEKAMNLWEIGLRDAVCADIGASTGGFTDCMLQNGAKTVYAVDVGYGQLDWKLRNDPRVINLEKTNARYLTRNEIPEALDFLSIDVSFISLEKILPSIRPLLKDGGTLVSLIKPQFEAGREKVGKKGVVRDPAVHEEVLERVTAFMKDAGFTILGLSYSPIRGPEGNIEYLAYLKNGEASEEETGSYSIPELVRESHEAV